MLFLHFVAVLLHIIYIILLLFNLDIYLLYYIMRMQKVISHEILLIVNT